MTFASSGFANSGFQTDEEEVGRVRRRNYYEIRGKLYFLSDEELEYLVSKLLAGDKVPEQKQKSEAIRVRAPKQWEPTPLPEIDWGVWDDLVVEAKTKHYTTMLGYLQRFDDDEDLILLLYG